VIFLPLGVSIASATTYDLVADWSDVANPNGPWTYREDGNALPHVDNWHPSLGSPVVQPAWAPSAESGNFLPAWIKFRSDNPGGLDVLTGDVAVHSTDDFNGPSSGIANVIWTSPLNGVIDISGAVWLTPDIDRGNTWNLLLNGVSLTSGELFSGDQFNRANPFNFANGSGGPAVLNGIAVSEGDVIELRIVKTSQFGVWAGVKLTITTVTQDSDGDGVADTEDRCQSSDKKPTVVIDDGTKICDSGAENDLLVEGDFAGCTVSDLIKQCAANATNHGEFVECVDGRTDTLVTAEIITGREKAAIQRCAARADIP
jgi:hypothetical protein